MGGPNAARVAGLVLTVALLASCGGEPATEVGGTDTTATATTGQEPEPDPVATCADPATAITTPEGFSGGEPEAVANAADAYARDMRDLGSDDLEADVAAAEAAGLQAATTRDWTRATADDLQDLVSVTIATFADADAAAGEFARVRARAEQEVPEFSAGGSDFAVPAGAMVQIDPNTGQPVGPTPHAELIVAQACEYIVQAYVLFADEAAYDASVSTRIVLDVTASG